MDESTEIELPRGVALAWGIAANPQRGPKRELSVERIVETAVELADADGLGAVSMSSIASKLGVTTMALYRYVTAKDDLITLMLEYGTGLPSASILEAPDWREGLRRWAAGSRAQYEAHPWLIDIPIVGTPNTPNNLLWMDAALGVLDSTPLDAEERIGALLLVTGQCRWEATINRGYDATNRTMGLSPSERDLEEERLIMGLVTPEMFPYLAKAAAAGIFTSEVDNFAFGLELVLDGIEHYIESKRAGTATDPPPREPGDAYPRDAAVKAARQARREAEQKLREAQKREREAVARARERERAAEAKERAKAAKER